MWVMLGVALAGLLSIVGPPHMARADATSTSFNPTTVTLASNGASATITVETVDADAESDGVQINIQHSDAVTITSPACVDVFSEANVLGPSAVEGGTLIGCFLLSGDVSATTGDVMTFVVTRVGPGNPVITFGVGGGLGTQLSDGGATVGPGATNTLRVVGPADLAVTKTDSPDPLPLGSDVTYIITVTNNGPTDASEVVLTDTLPDGATFVSAEPGSPTCAEADGAVTCVIGSLASSASMTVSVVVEPGEVGVIDSVARVSGMESDPEASNDSAAAQTTVEASSGSSWTLVLAVALAAPAVVLLGSFLWVMRRRRRFTQDPS